MSGYNFTDRVRKVLQMAREEAARLHHEYVGTEHIVLALVREGEGIAGAVLTSLKVDPKKIRDRVEQAVKKGKPDAPAGPDLPYTSSAKKILELAMREARELDCSYVGTEHLLLGAIAETKGIGAEVLAQAGVTLEAARAETSRLLGSESPAERARRVDATGFGRRHEQRTGILTRAWALARELEAEPPPDPARVRAIGAELKALVDELAGRF